MRRFPTGFVQRNTKGLKIIVEVIQKCITLDLRNRMGVEASPPKSGFKYYGGDTMYPTGFI